MAARLVRLDCAHGSVLVVCDPCAWRTMATTLPEARRAADDHRRHAHPAAQRRAESKRRTRAR